jgi:hypothetical protein
MVSFIYSFNVTKFEFKCVHGLLFIEMIYPNDKYAIDYLNVQTRQFNILDFSFKLEIKWIDGFNRGNLIVQTSQCLGALKMLHFYRIPFG